MTLRGQRGSSLQAAHDLAKTMPTAHAQSLSMRGDIGQYVSTKSVCSVLLDAARGIFKNTVSARALID